MKENKESTRFDRLRMAIGAILAVAGAAIFAYAGIVASFNLTITIAGILLILGGLLIAGSSKLADLIADITRF